MNSEKSVFTFQDSFWNESRKWIDKFQIQEFIGLKRFLVVKVCTVLTN